MLRWRRKLSIYATVVGVKDLVAHPSERFSRVIGFGGGQVQPFGTPFSGTVVRGQ